MAVLEINGRKVEVDDSFKTMTPEQQDATVDEIARSMMPAQQMQQPQQEQSYLSGLVDQFTQGAAFNFGDELTAAEAAVLGRTPQGGWFDYSQPMGQRYDEALAAERGQMGQFQQENPVASTTAQVAGAILSPASKPLAAARTIPQAIGAGAVSGGVAGFGAGEGGLENRAIEAAQGGALGGVAGGIMGAASKGLQSLARNRGVREYVEAAPEVKDIKAAASKLYDAAANRGVKVPQTDMQSLASRVRQVADDEGLIFASGEIDDVFPKVRSIIRKMDDVAQGEASVKQLQNLRKSFQRAAGSTDPAERRVGMQMLDELDDFAGQFAPELDEAKQIYARAKTAERIAQTNELASSRASQYSNSGMQNALRTEFRGLLRNIQKGKVKGISPELKEQVRKVAEGDGTAEDFLRWVGRFAPNSPFNTAAGALGVGAMTGNPLMGLAVPAVGATGRKLSEQATVQNSRLAEALARTGGSLPPAQQSRLAEYLMRTIPAVGQQSGN